MKEWPQGHFLWPCNFTKTLTLLSPLVCMLLGGGGRLFWRGHHLPACEDDLCLEKATLYDLVGDKITETFKARHVLSTRTAALGWDKSIACCHSQRWNQRVGYKEAMTLGFFWQPCWNRRQDWQLFMSGRASNNKNILTTLVLSCQASGLLKPLIPVRSRNLLLWASYSMNSFLYF